MSDTRERGSISGHNRSQTPTTASKRDRDRKQSRKGKDSVTVTPTTGSRRDRNKKKSPQAADRDKEDVGGSKSPEHLDVAYEDGRESQQQRFQRELVERVPTPLLHWASHSGLGRKNDALREADEITDSNLPGSNTNDNDDPGHEQIEAEHEDQAVPEAFTHPESPLRSLYPRQMSEIVSLADKMSPEELAQLVERFEHEYEVHPGRHNQALGDGAEIGLYGAGEGEGEGESDGENEGEGEDDYGYGYSGEGEGEGFSDEEEDYPTTQVDEKEIEAAAQDRILHGGVVSTFRGVKERRARMKRLPAIKKAQTLHVEAERLRVALEEENERLDAADQATRAHELEYERLKALFDKADTEAKATALAQARGEMALTTIPVAQKEAKAAKKRLDDAYALLQAARTEEQAVRHAAASLEKAAAVAELAASRVAPDLASMLAEEENEAKVIRQVGQLQRKAEEKVEKMKMRRSMKEQSEKEAAASKEAVRIEQAVAIARAAPLEAQRRIKERQRKEKQKREEQEKERRARDSMVIGDHGQGQGGAGGRRRVRNTDEEVSTQRRIQSILDLKKNIESAHRSLQGDAEREQKRREKERIAMEEESEKIRKAGGNPSIVFRKRAQEKKKKKIEQENKERHERNRVKIAEQLIEEELKYRKELEKRSRGRKKKAEAAERRRQREEAIVEDYMHTIAGQSGGVLDATGRSGLLPSIVMKKKEEEEEMRMMMEELEKRTRRKECDGEGEGEGYDSSSSDDDEFRERFELQSANAERQRELELEREIQEEKEREKEREKEKDKEKGKGKAKGQGQGQGKGKHQHSHQNQRTSHGHDSAGAGAQSNVQLEEEIIMEKEEETFAVPEFGGLWSADEVAKLKDQVRLQMQAGHKGVGGKGGANTMKPRSQWEKEKEKEREKEKEKPFSITSTVDVLEAVRNVDAQREKKKENEERRQLILSRSIAQREHIEGEGAEKEKEKEKEKMQSESVRMGKSIVVNHEYMTTTGNMASTLGRSQTILGREYSGPGFLAKPARVVFKDFQPGRKYTKQIELTNVSFSFNSFKILELAPDIRDFFHVSWEVIGRMSAGLTTKFSVSFAPLQNLDIIGGAIPIMGETGLMLIPLEAYTMKAVPTVTPMNSLYLDGVVLGETEQKDIVLRNDGALNAPFKIEMQNVMIGGKTFSSSSSSSSASSASPFSLSTYSGVIPPYGQYIVTVTFKPPSVSDVECTLKIKLWEEPISQLDSATGEVKVKVKKERKKDELKLIDTCELTVLGTGKATPVYSTVSEIDFKTCCVDRLYRNSITLKNREKMAFKYVINVPPMLADSLSFIPSLGYIQASASSNIQVKFKPTEKLLKKIREKEKEKEKEKAKEKNQSECGSLDTRIMIKVVGQVLPIYMTLKSLVTTTRVEFDPPAFHFGLCNLSESVALPISITNHSALIQNFGLVSKKCVTFQPNNGFGALLPGENMKIEARFSPDSAIEYSDDIEFLTDLNARNVLPFTGQGVKPSIRVAPSPVCRMPATWIGCKTSHDLYLENTTHTVKTIEFGKIEHSDLEFTPRVCTIAPRERAHVILTYSPKARVSEKEKREYGVYVYGEGEADEDGGVGSGGEGERDRDDGDRERDGKEKEKDKEKEKEKEKDKKKERGAIKGKSKGTPRRGKREDEREKEKEREEREKMKEKEKEKEHERERDRERGKEKEEEREKEREGEREREGRREREREKELDGTNQEIIESQSASKQRHMLLNGEGNGPKLNTSSFLIALKSRLKAIGVRESSEGEGGGEGEGEEESESEGEGEKGGEEKEREREDDSDKRVGMGREDAQAKEKEKEKGKEKDKDTEWCHRSSWTIPLYVLTGESPDEWSPNPSSEQQYTLQQYNTLYLLVHTCATLPKVVITNRDAERDVLLSDVVNQLVHEERATDMPHSTLDIDNSEEGGGEGGSEVEGELSAMGSGNYVLGFGTIPIGGEKAMKTLHLLNISNDTVKLALQKSSMCPVGPFDLCKAIRPIKPHTVGHIRFSFHPQVESLFHESIVLSAVVEGEGVGEAEREGVVRRGGGGGGGEVQVYLAGNGVKPTLSLDPHPEDSIVDCGDVLCTSANAKSVSASASASLVNNPSTMQYVNIRNSSKFSVECKIVVQVKGERNVGRLSEFDCAPACVMIRSNECERVNINFTPDHQGRFMADLCISAKSQKEREKEKEKSSANEGEGEVSRTQSEIHVTLIGRGWANGMYVVSSEEEDKTKHNVLNAWETLHEENQTDLTMTVIAGAPKSGGGSAGSSSLEFGCLRYEKDKDKERDRGDSKMSGEFILDPLPPQAVRDGFSVSAMKGTVEAGYRKAVNVIFDPSQSTQVNPSNVQSSEDKNVRSSALVPGQWVEHILTGTLKGGYPPCGTDALAGAAAGLRFSVLIRGFVGKSLGLTRSRSTVLLKAVSREEEEKKKKKGRKERDVSVKKKK